MTKHDCRHLLDSLSEYVDGDLNESLCAEIEAHMTECENCRVVVDTLALTVKLYRETTTPVLPDAVRSRLYATLDLDHYRTDQAE